LLKKSEKMAGKVASLGLDFTIDIFLGV